MYVSEKVGWGLPHHRCLLSVGQALPYKLVAHLTFGKVYPVNRSQFCSTSLIFFATFWFGRAFIITMTVETGRKRAHKQGNLTVSESEHVDLVRRACSNPDAFARLYLMHYDNIFRYCVRRLFDRHCAEDVTSTVFFKVMHNLDSFDGTTIDFRSWLLRIATNAVNDHLRDARRRKEAIEKSLEKYPAESGIATDRERELLERKMLLKKALLGLKPKYQTVITLRFFVDMKLTEIAACLGKKPSTVRCWLSRATAKLREKLDSDANNRGLT